MPWGKKGDGAGKDVKGDGKGKRHSDGHRRAAMAALTLGLQGLHGQVKDMAGATMDGTKVTITVNSTAHSLVTER